MGRCAGRVGEKLHCKCLMSDFLMSDFVELEEADVF